MTDQPDDQQPRHPLADNGEFQALHRLSLANQRRQIELSRIGAELRPDSLIIRRVEMVIDVIFPEDSLDRVRFEMEWQRLIASSLDDMESEINRRKISPAGGGLIVPNGTRKK